MRAERLEREKRERARATRLITGEPDPEEVAARRKEAEEAARASRQRYSSQFNPEAARQNKLDSKRKYWLD